MQLFRLFLTAFSTNKFLGLGHLSLIVSLLLSAQLALAGIESSVTGNVTDADGVAVSGAKVKLLSKDGHVVKETTTSQTGEFDFFPIDFGTYDLVINAVGLPDYRASANVTSSSTTRVDAQLSKPSEAKEYVLNVKEKRSLIQSSSSGTKTDITQEEIKSLPGGDSISLPKLVATTTPGIIQGPFGQMFIRGNHANIQYQIDGVQLPDSMSGTFGEAFSPRNIDHMEIITGGVPAEYGERMAAVMNIVTKSGPETPTGSAEMNYGSYNTINPQASYGGSDSSGRLRYFVTANYMSTDRGLDTPEPKSYDDQSHGGSDAVHDHATGNDEFARLDYTLDNDNKFSVNLFNSSRKYEIPNFPSSFHANDPYFANSNSPTPYADQFGNIGANSWSPAITGDNQVEQNSYIELVWKKTFNEHSFLQVSPYYKRSALTFNNDPANDLLTTNPNPSSFAMNRAVDNYGLKTDYTLRPNDSHLVKSGFQLQQSNGSGQFSLQTAANALPTVYGTPDHGSLEAVYLEDAYSIAKPLVLNVGVRFSAIQFNTEGLSSQDSLVQPRVGLEYRVTDTTKLHVFYGKLFQPSPFEDLRDAFSNNGGNGAVPYDVKAEKDDYYEAGVAQEVAGSQVVSLTYYYKDATNMLDDTQLLNTSIAQPYNFAKGFATGLEFSVTGTLSNKWSDFFNYSYEDARGQGISGGAFTQPVDTDLNAPYQFLDHVQLNTANAGLTYRTDDYWATVTGLFGSGLRTRSDNGGALPAHTTFDFTVGYNFHDTSWWSKWRVSADVINVLDDAYVITVANGYNGNHYSAGREYFLRLAKEL